MICPQCQNQNRADALFCDECGGKLETICGQCGAPNRTAAKFCSACGQSLTSPPPSQLAPSAAAPPADRVVPKHLAEKILAGRQLLAGERKKITVLFADIRGSTKLLEGLDPEAAQLLIDPILHIMMDAVHLYEGTVNQVLGDGIMALFGAPIAHEDHALRACYAALAMQKELRAHHQKLGQSESEGVQIGVGLNTGEVVVRSIDSDLHLDYSALGHTTHLAARMQELAGGGIALMTTSTLREVEGFIQIQPRGAVNAKGVSQPVEVFELVAATSARTRVQAALASGLTPFVGRQVEIELFDKLIQQTLGGRGQILAMVGDPGMGKSRLVYEFTRFHLPSGWLVAEGAAVSYGKATPYFPLIELLRRYFAITEDDSIESIQAKVAIQLLDLDAALRDVAAPILSLLGALPEPLREDAANQLDGLGRFADTLDAAKTFIALEPQQRRSYTLDALTRLWLRESQRQPLFLVFEDLQWIDSETEAFLDRLVESLPRARIFLLVNFRPSYDHDWAGKSYYSHLRIEPLRSLSAEELLRHLLGTDRDLTDLTRLLIERTDGNPFFAEETVRALVETGVLVGERGAYRRGLKVVNIAIPSTVQNVVADRIDRLPMAEKQLLQTAAVIGVSVPYPLLRAVTGLPEDSLKIALGHLQAAEFIHEASLFPELEFTFKHALICEVAYGALLRERRTLLHAQVLTALEHVKGTASHDHLEKLAHHALRGELWDKAVDYLEQAAGKAVARSANREASDFYSSCLAAIQHLPQTGDILRRAVDIRLELRNPLFLLGQFEELHRSLREAEIIAERIGDQKRLGRVLNFLISYYSLVGEHGRAIESGSRGLRSNPGDLELNTVTHYYMGQAYHHLGQYRQSIATLSQALHGVSDARYQFERFGTANVISVICRSWLAQGLAQLGEFDDGIAIAEESIGIAQQSEHAYSLAYAWCILGFVWLLRGEVEKAIGALEKSQAICASKDIRVLMTHIGSNLGYAYALAGRFDDAIPLMQRAEAQSQSIGRKAAWALRLTWLGQTLELAGQPESALEHGRRGLEFATDLEEQGYQAWALKLLGDIAQAQAPDLAQARGYYDRSMALASRLEMRPLQAHLHLSNGRTDKRGQQIENARAALSRACELYRQMKMPLWLQVAQQELNCLTA